MPWNDIGSALQCNLAAAIQNWDQNRPYTASLTHRREGFTEEWGNDNHRASPYIPDDDHERNRRLYLEQPLLRLHQYRPAWLEQLVMRVAGLQYRVFNSPYAVHELTGPLPLLQDLSGQESSSSTTSAPAMVGREQQHRIRGKTWSSSDGSTYYNNSILDYLKRYRSIDLDQALDDDQRQQSVLYTTLIQETLNKLCLYGLRYGDNDDCWEQIYQPQCYRAANPQHNRSKSKHWWTVQPLASFQAWSERRYMRSRYSSSSINKAHVRPVDQLVAAARRAYQVLEHQLQKENQQNNSNSNAKFSYLLGTPDPTVVDCLLWDHLMQALTDVHLVVVLAEFPMLLQFTQHLWDTYHFGVAVDDNNNNKTRRRIAQPALLLSVWNWEENALNAFNEVPLLPARLGNDSDVDDDDDQRKLRHAVDLMKKLSVHDLNASLQLVQQLRQNENINTPQHPFATWHRWRMGGTLYEADDRTRATAEQTDHVNRSSRAQQTSPPDASSNEQRIQREHQRNDELWIAGVAAMSLAIVLGFGFAGSSR